MVPRGCQASAFYRGLAKPKFGDPDEFQSQKYHGESGERFTSTCSGGRARKAATEDQEVAKQARQEARRYLSVSFAGRTFFLER